MAVFEGANSNFDSGVSGQTNEIWMPEVYSKNVQMFFRRTSVTDDVTSNDYMGEISAFGDTVQIVKEPTITTYDYTRGSDVTQTTLTDQELTLVVDQARAFKFIVDDIEKKMSHIGWMDVASKSAAYSLRNHMDQNVLTYMQGNVDASLTVGGDDATAVGLDSVSATESVLIGHDSGDTDPLNLLSRLARLLDDNDVPEEDRWVIASPQFYEILGDSASKLLSVDYNAGQGSLRNGLVSSGKLRGFSMYKSNNMDAPTNAEGVVLAGHKSAVASGGTLLNTEVLRHQDSFGDLVRGLHVFGRKVLRDDALAMAYWSTTSDT